ncbi:MAG: TRAP transporter substrate-binding protein [Oscillospiraceae bacterium]
MKKLICTLLAAVMMLTMFAGCSEKTANTNPSGSDKPSSTGSATTDGQKEAEPDKAVTLRYATHMSSTSDTGKLLQAWLDDMNEKSNGSITVNPYWQASLVAPINAYAETSAGVTDFMTHAPGNETDHFILESALTYMYCGQLSNADQLAVAHELWEKVPEWQEEFSDVEVLGFGSAGNTFYILSNTPVKTLDDLKGMDIRVMEQWAFDLMLDLGANPVKMPLGEMYEGLQKGVIDGVLLCESHYLSENLTEYISYMTNLRITPAPCVWTYVNKGVFDKLSANQQEIVKTCSADSEQAILNATVQWDEAARAAAKEKGVEVFTISDADLAKITEVAQSNALEQVEKLNAAGYDGTGIYEELQKLIEARK